MSATGLHSALCNTLPSSAILSGKGNLNPDMGKPVFRVSDQVQHKPSCTATEDGQTTAISDLGSRQTILCIWRK